MGQKKSWKTVFKVDGQRMVTECGLVIGRGRLEIDGHGEIAHGKAGLTKSCSANDDDDDDD